MLPSFILQYRVLQGICQIDMESACPVCRFPADRKDAHRAIRGGGPPRLRCARNVGFGRYRADYARIPQANHALNEQNGRALSDFTHN